MWATMLLTTSKGGFHDVRRHDITYWYHRKFYWAHDVAGAYHCMKIKDMENPGTDIDYGTEACSVQNCSAKNADGVQSPPGVPNDNPVPDQGSSTFRGTGSSGQRFPGGASGTGTPGLVDPLGGPPGTRSKPGILPKQYEASHNHGSRLKSFPLLAPLARLLLKIISGRIDLFGR